MKMAKQKVRSGLLATAPAIKKLHTFLEKEIGAIVDNTLAIASPSGETWAKQIHNVLIFAMKQEGPRQAVVRADGRNYPVLLLGEHDAARPFQVERWWVSWYEEWLPQGGGWFALRSAGWTVFCDLGAAIEDASLVVRAEWGPMREDGSSESSAGQPHWHSHNVPSVFNLQRLASGQITASSIAENRIISENAPDAVDISEIHLAMAGWTHGSDKPWHFPLAAAFPRSLQEWAPVVLKYIQMQLPHARPAYL
jgi:hypothetical protein